MQWFTKATRHLDRFGIWLGAFTALGGAYSWLASRMTAFRNLPWPELLAIGIAAALVTMLLVTASLAMWRLFRPLADARLKAADQDHSALPPDLTPELVPLPFDPKGLYVGLMQVDTQHLDERRIIEVVALCFNATGHSIDIQRVSGTIKVSEVKDGTQAEIAELPPPWLLDDRATARDIKNYAEFMVLLEQRLPAEVAAKFSELREGYDLHLDLDSLDVRVGSHDEPHLSARLPLWNSLRLYRHPSRPLVGKGVIARARAFESTLAFTKD